MCKRSCLIGLMCCAQNKQARCLGTTSRSKVCSAPDKILEMCHRLISLKGSFVSTGSIPIGMDKYDKKIMIVTIKDLDLFRVEN
jgi:hypothetical protein